MIHRGRRRESDRIRCSWQHCLELTQPSLQGWSQKLSQLFDEGITEAQHEVSPPTSHAWFYNPITSPATSQAAKNITWTAFPKLVSDAAATPRAAWGIAELDRETQSEYCEWETLRDPARNNKVIRVTFSSETPDYYTYLADAATDELLAVYRKHVSAQVQLADLFADNQYNPRNRWNWPQQSAANGAFMHMAQTNNSLSAAVILAAVAPWPTRPRSGPTDHPGTTTDRLRAFR